MSHETRTKPPTYPEILDIHDGAFSESIWGSDGFRTIKVTGQDDVIADSYKDDLTIAAGTNVTLTTSASGDSLTIASTPYTAGTGIQLSGTEFSITALAITSVHSVANETAHLALTTQEGDVVVRTDENKSYIRNTGTAGTMNDFTLLQTPTDLVLSVAGNVGHITNNQIRDAVEAATDSNTFTDNDHSKLNAIEASATADQTSTEIKSLLAGDNITGSHIADDAIDSDHYVDGSIDHVHLSGDCVDGDNISDDSINSEHYVDGSIDEQHIANDAVTYAKMQNVSATNKVLGRDSSGAGVVEEISPADLRTMINVEDAADVTDTTNVTSAGAVMKSIVDNKGDIIAGTTDNTYAKLPAGTNDYLLTTDSSEATGLKWRAENAHSDKVNQDAFSIVAVSGQDNVVADAAQDTLTFAAGTNVTVTTNATSDTVTIAAADTSKMPLAGGTFTGDVTINDDEELGFGSQNDLVIVHDGTDGLIKETTGDLDIRAKNTNGGIVSISDSAGENLIKATAGSSVILTYDGTDRVTTTNTGVTVAGTLIADLDINTSTISDLQATITDSDANIPTSGAVVDYVTSRLAPIGGLEVIDDDESFPNTIPAAGVVVSIADVGGLSVNSSGVSTNGDALDNSTITINGFPSELRGGATVGGQTNADPYVFGAGAGLMVQSTGSSHTYNYHQALIRESDFVRLSSDLDDFQERYRIASSAPSSNNDDGDLYFDTTAKKMKVYNAATSEWDDVAQSSESHIVTLSESFDGSRTDFTMSTAATDAQSTIVSINGVIQKPNAGTSTPSEGFAISSTTLKLSNAPATGSDYFVVVLGDTVSIGTPSDDTVTGAKIVDDAVGAEHIEVLDAALQFGDSVKAQFGTDNDLEIYHDNSHGRIVNKTGHFYLRANATDTAIEMVPEGTTKLRWDGSNKFETKSTGAQISGQLQFADGAGSSGTNMVTFGNSDDLKIYHDGDDNRIDAYEDLIIRKGASEDMAKFVNNGAVELYFDGSKKFETNERGILVSNTEDNDTVLELKAGNEGNAAILKMTADQEDDNTDRFRLYVPDSDGISIQGWNGSAWETYLKGEGDKVELYYDGSGPKLNTNANGVHITDTLSFANTGASITLADDQKLSCGNGGDLHIYHDEDDSYIEERGTGHLNISSNVLNIYNSAIDEYQARFVQNDRVELRFDGSTKFETFTNGIDVSGQVRVTASSSGYGSNFYDDIKSGWGDSQDLQIYHDGIHSYIDNITGNLKIRNAGSNNSSNIYIQAVDGEDSIICRDDAQVELYHNGNLKLETNSAGIVVDGGVYPETDNSTDLGSNAGRWDDVYATNDQIQTSDRNEKEDITSTDLGLSFVNKLTPVSYKRKGKTRTHYGLVAQDVETVITDLGKTTTQFAPLVKDILEDGTERYGLRYGEFISPLIKAIQELTAEVQTLKTKVATLEAK